MPLPSPQKDEDQSKFISRCAGDETMNKDYPDTKQRVAICYSQWKNKDKKDPDSAKAFNLYIKS